MTLTGEICQGPAAKWPVLTALTVEVSMSVVGALPLPQPSDSKLLLGWHHTVGKVLNKTARQEIATFLQMPDVTRGGLLATADSYLKPFLSERVEASLERSTFALTDVREGRPLSIYLIIPPDKLQSHKGLLKFWVSTLLRAITSPGPTHYAFPKLAPARRTSSRKSVSVAADKRLHGMLSWLGCLFNSPKAIRRSNARFSCPAGQGATTGPGFVPRHFTRRPNKRNLTPHSPPSVAGGTSHPP
jgi:hypothetical protein